MAIITLVSEKGGAGKSTLACHLAAEYRSRGLSVLLADADPQGSSVAWAEVAAEAGQDAPDVVALGDQIRQTLPGLAEGRDVVIVDTAGRVGKRAVAAMLVSDLALVPVTPSPQDVWGLSSTLDNVATVQEVRPELRAAIVVNAKGRTALSRGVRAGLEETGFPVLATEVARRVAHQEAIATGQGVTTYASGSSAATEVVALADEIAALLGIREVSRAEAV